MNSGRPRNENGPKRFRSVSVDPDVQEALAAYQASLKPVLGFKPTISQAIKYLLNTAGV